MPSIHRTQQHRAYTIASGYDRLDDVMANCVRLYIAALEDSHTAYRQAGVNLTMYDQMKELARFGVGMVDTMLKARGGGLIIVDETEVDDDPVSWYGAGSCARHD